MIASIVLSKTTLPFIPEDLYKTIDSFLIWDKTTAQYARFRASHTVLQEIHFQILYGFSRRNGFQNQSDADSEDPHWAFSSYDLSVQLQAINCKQCGCYIVSHNPVPKAHQCVCDAWFDY